MEVGFIVPGFLCKQFRSRSGPTKYLGKDDFEKKKSANDKTNGQLPCMQIIECTNCNCRFKDR